MIVVVFLPENWLQHFLNGGRIGLSWDNGNTDAMFLSFSIEIILVYIVFFFSLKYPSIFFPILKAESVIFFFLGLQVFFQVKAPFISGNSPKRLKNFFFFEILRLVFYFRSFGKFFILNWPLFQFNFENCETQQ